MNRQCFACQLINFSHDELCRRCGAKLIVETAKERVEPENDLGKKLDAGAFWFLKRLATALAISVVLLIFAYFSLLASAARLSAEQRRQVDQAIAVLDERGFKDEVFWLRFAAFRANDNWFNALTGHADAYAATNFPFQIVTLYEDFFNASTDATERAAILLHEAQHLKGAGEPHAYAYVWRNRQKLGWTRENYGDTRIFLNVFKSTRHYAPFIFRCDQNPQNDCTE